MKEAAVTKGGVVYISDGQVLPIVSWWDEDGDDCDPSEAIVIQAGPDVDGYFLTIDLSGNNGVAWQ